MLRRTMVLVKPLPIQTVPSCPSWAPLPHTGENSSASGVSVLGDLYAQFTQCLFNAQCGLSLRGR